MVGQESGIGSGSNGGPIRRSPNWTSTRYQPFGKETIDLNNNIGSQRIGQSSSKSIFNIPQNFNQYTQGYYGRKENEDGAPGQLH
ncbi:hypothetical protein H5410_004613 [Solanum commersonii]|uniref:Uncharacterized protein n=1 Tax=Solanum commersonii TaxID=4109 RepID=A0A9J6B854_SOLCO|nr:hypothetical protein H5410_004613 [Solanum commersonii]